MNLLGLANLKQNPGVDLIILKSSVFSNKPKELLSCLWTILEADQNQLVAIALSEATCIWSIGHRQMIPETVERMGFGEGR